MLFKVLSKFLIFPLYPLTGSILLQFIALLFFFLKKNRIALVFQVLSISVLLFFSWPPTAFLLTRSLEKQFSQQHEYPQASAIVLLGGSEVPPVAPRLYDETNNAGDRILHAARLLKRGFAPIIITTGGKNSFIHNFEGAEANVSFRLLTSLFGIDSSKVITETLAGNTYENALYTAKVMDSLKIQKKIILVTSALHMKRSEAIFKKMGYEVYPAPTDYQVDAYFQWNFYNLFPKADALFKSTNWVHEQIGIFTYKMMGYI